MIDQGGQLGEGGIGEHGCGEPLCVCVDQAHLWPATQSENIRCVVDLGRPRGNVTFTGGHPRGPARRSPCPATGVLSRRSFRPRRWRNCARSGNSCETRRW